jgi:DNA-binding transcriptional regulator LsrR (DeoR family)
VAVTSCGAVLKPEPRSGLARLLRETQSKKSYERVLKELQEKKVVGDLMYHFLRADGQVVQVGTTCRSLERARLAQLYGNHPRKDTPAVFSVSPDGLATIAQRGVCLLVVHSPERAQVAHAALRRKSRPINFIVTSKAAAETLLKLS